ncbi:MAG: response regulator [Acidobacteria bacterium]|nr:response regulator [Acidobacteriota bacterium]
MRRVALVQVIVFFLVVLLLGGVWYLQQENKTGFVRNEFQVVSRQFSIRLQEFINTRIAITENLAAELQGVGVNPDDFQSHALKLYHKFPGFKAIDHINDRGIIDVVVPLKENKSVLFLDLTKTDRFKAFFRTAMRTGLTVVSTPIQLVNKKPGFVVMAPISGEKGPVGVVAGVFDVDRVMRLCFTKMELATYRFRLTDTEARNVLFPPGGHTSVLRNSKQYCERVALSVGSRTWNMEVIRPRESGFSLLFAFLSWFAIFFVAGTISYFVGRFLKNNHELKVNESRFRALLDAIPDAFILLEPDGKVVDYHAPRGWVCFETLSDDIIRSGDFLSALMEDSLKAHSAKLLRHCVEKHQIQEMEVHLSGPHGGQDVEMRFIPYGKDLTLLMIRDISRQKQAEKRLNASMERYQTIFEASQDPIFITTKGGRMVEMNRAGLDFFGAKTLGQLKALQVEDVYENRDDRKKLIEDLQRDGFVRNRRLTLRRIDGTTREAMISVRLQQNEFGGEKLLVGTLHDITELVNLQEQLFQAQKMESIGRLAGGVAHDFNNILSGVMGYASLMKSKMSSAHPFYDYVETIERGAVRAAELTARLLGFARKGQFSMVRLNVNTIVSDTAKLLQSTIAKTIEIKLNLLDDVPAIWGDPSQIHQVVMNLCVNARDAMPDGGRLTLSSGSRYIANPPGTPERPLQEGTYVFIRIKDTGSGMNAETKQKIFEPFFTTKADKGTGLGLAMVYGVVQNHGGFIDVETKPGIGSTFTIYFPEAGRNKEKEIVISEEDRTTRTETGCVLFVDDEADNRSLAKEILGIHGIEVIPAADGLEALELYRKNRDKIDAVVLDMIMPKMDGKEVFFELKEMDESVNVMLISGYSNDGEIKKLTDENKLLFLRKPFKIDEMVRKVQELISRKK